MQCCQSRPDISTFFHITVCWIFGPQACYTEVIVSCCIHPGIFFGRVPIWAMVAFFDSDYSQPSSCSTVYNLCRSENVATYSKKPNHTYASQGTLCQLPRQKPVRCLWWTVEKDFVVAW